MSPESVHSLLALAFGFAVAGLFASFYQLVTERPPSFKLLSKHTTSSSVLALPFLMFTAPFIIMRNTIRRTQVEEGGFGFAMLATMLAGFWSLVSGALVMNVIEAVSLLVA